MKTQTKTQPASLPPVARWQDKVMHAIPASELAKLLDTAAGFSMSGDTRYALDGIQIRLGATGIHIAATDTMIFYRDFYSWSESGVLGGGVIDRKAAIDLAKWLRKCGKFATAILNCSASILQVRCGPQCGGAPARDRAHMQYLEFLPGRFPRIEDCVPAEFSYRSGVCPVSLASALEDLRGDVTLNRPCVVLEISNKSNEYPVSLRTECGLGRSHAVAGPGAKLKCPAGESCAAIIDLKNLAKIAVAMHDKYNRSPADLLMNDSRSAVIFRRGTTECGVMPCNPD